MIVAPSFIHHLHAARLLIVYARAESDLTWASLLESADRVETCERLAEEIRDDAEDDWQAELLNAIDAEDAR